MRGTEEKEDINVANRGKKGKFDTTLKKKVSIVLTATYIILWRPPRRAL